jgi:hypothetical protein
MGITFAQLKKHLVQEDKWFGFDACTFEVRLMTVSDALGCLSAWSKGTASIRDYVKTTGPENLPDAERISLYAADFHLGPVILVAFSLGTLRHVWPAEYGGATGDDLVVWDGHHRAAALAIREADGKSDDHPVLVFVGSKNP